VIPKIDNDIGITVYSTNFEGCGGRIRTKKDDFQVSEVLSEKTMREISSEGDYAVFKLKKFGIDTTHSLGNIFNKYRIRLKSLGLKDAIAVTEQFVCSEKKLKSIDRISEEKYSLKRIGFVKKPLSKKDMIGNRFRIKITETINDISKFSDYDKILNFYGYQRFGSKRPVTHLIGKALLQNDYSKAIDLLLSFTTEYDTPDNANLRKKLSDKSNYLKQDNPKNAIRTLPLSIRRFFVQAYQSFLFNKTLSLSFVDGEDLFKATQGDICYDKLGNIGKFTNDLGQRLAVPFIGYSYYKKTRFHYQISKILDSEEISPKDFFLKEMQEISNEGGFRNAEIACNDFNINENWVAFRLSRGSFATIVLREIMKPEDPILAGF
jgi:tRNA pseudouridine13 synthase